MKLHPNGTIEGTPTEISEYTKLQSKREQFKVIQPNVTSDTKEDQRYPGSGVIYVGTVQPKVSMGEYVSPADYVRGLLSSISGKGSLH